MRKLTRERILRITKNMRIWFFCVPTVLALFAFLLQAPFIRLETPLGSLCYSASFLQKRLADRFLMYSRGREV
jgi:hypothetical protein